MKTDYVVLVPKAVFHRQKPGNILYIYRWFRVFFHSIAILCITPSLTPTNLLRNEQKRELIMLFRKECSSILLFFFYNFIAKKIKKFRLVSPKPLNILGWWLERLFKYFANFQFTIGKLFILNSLNNLYLIFSSFLLWRNQISLFSY